MMMTTVLLALALQSPGATLPAAAATTVAVAAETALTETASTPAASAPAAADTASSSAGEPEESDLVPGRPGFTESRGVVPRGALQVEGGYSFTADRADGVSTWTSAAPGAVVRLGLGHRAEVRLGSAGLVYQRVTSSFDRVSSSAVGDTQLSMKMLLTTERSAPVEIGVVPSLSIPSRQAGASTFGYDPAVTVSAARALPRGFDLTGLVRASWLTIDGARTFRPSASLATAHGVVARWVASGEVFVTPDPLSGETTWSVGAAVARNLGRRFQLDLDAGHSLNRAAPTWAFGAGFVVRP
jgi:hypothetical protein